MDESTTSLKRLTGQCPRTVQPVPDSTIVTVSDRQRRVLLATVPSDAHMWNLVFLQLLLEEHGHEVHNLGHCTPLDDIVSAAAQWQPDAIVISTVNGHGHIEGVRLIERLRSEPTLHEVPVVIGGKLGITGSSGDGHARLLEAGFDSVIEAATTADPSDAMLRTLVEAPRKLSA